MSATIIVVFTVVYLIITLYLCKGVSFTTRDLCYCGICIAITVALESVRVPLPTGSTIPLASLLPLMVLAVYNYKLAMISGFVTGVMVLFFIPGWQPVHWGQIFVEHFVCFSCIGYTGIFGNKNKVKILLGAIIASVLEVCGHLFSGVLFFSQNAWDGWGAWGYSLGYNLSSNVPLTIICMVLLMSIPLKTLHMLTKEKI